MKTQLQKVEPDPRADGDHSVMQYTSMTLTQLDEIIKTVESKINKRKTMPVSIHHAIMGLQEYSTRIHEHDNYDDNKTYRPVTMLLNRVISWYNTGYAYDF